MRRAALLCAVVWGRMKSCARLSTAQYKAPRGLDKRVTNPLQVVNLPHAGLRSSIIAAAIAVLWLSAAGAQIIRRGQTVTPAFEGWELNPDGSFNLVFGYFNRNWEQEFHLPVGPDNNVEPGGPDQGQPTWFFPRRNHFIFSIHVPKDFGTKEIVWSITTNGKTEKAYGSLKPDYVLDDIVRMGNIGAGGSLSITPDMVGNKPPVLILEGGKVRSVKAGEPLTLAATATDDGKPNPRPMPRALGGDYLLPNSANGLRLAWFVYRGQAPAVTFDPPQSKVWEDTRDGGNSPWSAGWVNPPIPPGNKWIVHAIFREPGNYVLRCLAHDGGLGSFEDVEIAVSP
jgi:hypothetical protein